MEQAHKRLDALQVLLIVHLLGDLAEEDVAGEVAQLEKLVEVL